MLPRHDAIFARYYAITMIRLRYYAIRCCYADIFSWLFACYAIYAAMLLICAFRCSFDADCRAFAIAIDTGAAADDAAYRHYADTMLMTYATLMIATIR